MPSPFLHRRIVEFADTDMAGIMHFGSFFLFMESAEHALLRSVGLSVYRRNGDDGSALSFPRVSARCDYHSPAHCEDELEIEALVQRLGNSSITYGFRFLRAGDEIAIGEMTGVCCRIEHGKPPASIAIPDEVIEALRPHTIVSSE